jgi:hypothetical protein
MSFLHFSSSAFISSSITREQYFQRLGFCMGLNPSRNDNFVITGSFYFHHGRLGFSGQNNPRRGTARLSLEIRGRSPFLRFFVLPAKAMGTDIRSNRKPTNA